MSWFSFAFHFFEYREFSIVVLLCPMCDKISGFGLLASKIITRECKYLESLGSILFMQPDQFFIVTFCVAALGGHVDDQSTFETIHLLAKGGCTLRGVVEHLERHVPAVGVLGLNVTEQKVLCFLSLRDWLWASARLFLLLRLQFTLRNWLFGGGLLTFGHWFFVGEIFALGNRLFVLRSWPSFGDRFLNIFDIFWLLDDRFRFLFLFGLGRLILCLGVLAHFRPLGLAKLLGLLSVELIAIHTFLFFKELGSENHIITRWHIWIFEFF